MGGYTLQAQITLLYTALGGSLLALLLVVVALIRVPAEARRRMALPMAGFGYLDGTLVTMACVRLIGIHAGVDTTDLALAIEFGGICIAGVVLTAMWVRRRARGRREQR